MSTTRSSSSLKGPSWVIALVLLVCLVPVLYLLSSLNEITPLDPQSLGLLAANTVSSISSGITTNDHYEERIRLLEERLAAMQTASGGSAASWNPQISPLSIPQGRAQNLPSVREENKQVEAKRKWYGGKGDGQHLGGFTDFDMHGISPNVWRNMISEFGIHSLMDVGCGRGVSTLWFHLQGLDTLCVEGSHDAVEQSMLPNTTELVVEHDFSRGPWWPEKTYDAAWSVEFLEHVGVNYHFNYISTFRKAAILFVTSSRWGGWHHVEVHKDDWWIRKYQSYGFLFDEELTNKVRGWTNPERRNTSDFAPDGNHYNAQHIGLSMKVFINPTVAALPQHAHLFFQHGCFEKRVENQIITRPCNANSKNSAESELPPSFFPLPINWTAHDEWKRIVASNIKHPEPSPVRKLADQLRKKKAEEKLKLQQQQSALG